MATGRVKVPLALVFACSLAIIGLLTTSSASTEWVNAVAHRQNRTETNLTDAPNDDGSIPDFTGEIQFGIFRGQKIFNYGYQQRDPVSFSIYTEHHPDVYNKGYPIAVFIFIAIAGIFALVSTVFGLINIVTIPIETINGPIGLYLWNGIGAVASLVAWVVYLVLYLTKLKTNVLNKMDIGKPYFFRTSSVFLGYSYWFVVASSGLFLVNLLLVFLAQRLRDPEFLRREKRQLDISKGANNIGMDEMMY